MQLGGRGAVPGGYIGEGRTVGLNKIYNVDVLEGLKTLPDNSINCCVTSPPYWGLRDYGVEGQLGLEKTPEEYVAKMVEVFREVKRVLRTDGTLWLNLGDSYASGKQKECKNTDLMWSNNQSRKPSDNYKHKDLVGIPWMVAFALRADGWYLRSDIIWHKPNPMPESVTDRPTKAHEYIFLLSKSERYYYDHDAIKERATSEQGKGATGRGKQGYAVASGKGIQPQQDHSGWCGGDGMNRNKRTVWTVSTKPFKGAHFATFPEALIIPCILAGCPEGGMVLDPFMGSGTTAKVAYENNRNYVGFEINHEYIEIANKRLTGIQRKLFA